MSPHDCRVSINITNNFPEGPLDRLYSSKSHSRMPSGHSSWYHRYEIVNKPAEKDMGNDRFCLQISVCFSHRAPKI